MSWLTDQATRARLALVLGLVLGGVGVGVVGTQLPGLTTAEADGEDTEAGGEGDEGVAHPFLLEEISFRATPDTGAILTGGAVKAHAVALLDRPCNETSPSLPHFYLVPSHTARADDAAAGFVSIGRSRLGVAEDGRRLQTCLVRLTVDVSVSSAAAGYVLADVAADDVADDASAEPVTDAVLMPYTLTLFMGVDAYVLLLVSALLVAVPGTAWIGQRSPDGKNVLAPTSEEKDGTPPSYPVMAGIAAALTAVSGTTVAWSELVPTLHLGGVTVVALVSAVLVAIGETVVKQRGPNAPTPLFGHLLRVLGTALLALLPPLILLYGATVGPGSLVIWIGVVAALMVVAGLALPDGVRPRSSREG